LLDHNEAACAAEPCSWMFHGVDRRENGDGTVTLTLTGWNYPADAERAEHGPGRITAETPCATRTIPLQTAEFGSGDVRQVVESRDAYDMVREHTGGPYTVVWQGRGWTVELKSGFALWQVTS
jgi:hypothetical protein